MKRIGIIYWAKGGNVENVANKIYNHYDKTSASIFDIMSIEATDLVNYDCLIIGGSTVGAEIWEDANDSNNWNVFFKALDNVNLKDKNIALFGLGDQILYPNNFVDGIAVIKEELEKRGAILVGRWSTEGYKFTDSLAVEDDKFVGLAIDEDQEPELTDERIDKWLEQIKGEMDC